MKYVIVTVPADTPTTAPLDASTVAMPVLLLLHVPLVVAWLSTDVSPTHAFSVPVIAPVAPLTVTVVAL